MSVYGEFYRYLEALIGQLEEREDAGDRNLIATLRDARPDGSIDLSESARRVLDALSDARIDVRPGDPSPRDAGDARLQEPCEHLSAICRIVVGA